LSFFIAAALSTPTKAALGRFVNDQIAKYNTKKDGVDAISPAGGSQT